MATSFSGPIIPGFAPDPSIVCVNKTYFLVNSSFHLFPGLPVYASKNLKTWTQIGNAINRPTQLSLDHSLTLETQVQDGSKLIGTTGLLAPTIRYHAGKFYIVCTNFSFQIATGGPKPMVQNFYVSTEDIWSDNWSDPVYYDWNGIDPSLFFDDDGRAYIQGHWSIGSRLTQPTGTIKQAEVEISTGKLLTEPREIWGGWSKHDTEGPHVYKKDGWYYLLAAEGGTFEHHMLSIARSRDIFGPYEAYEHNPILTADGKDEYVQNTGHGDIFKDAEGQWWATVLGIRRDKEGRNTMGRETFLTPVEWPEDRWPTFSQPRIQMSRESKVLALPDLPHKRKPSLDLVYLRKYLAENYNISADCRILKLMASKADFSGITGTCTFAGKGQRSLETVFSAKLTLPGRGGEKVDGGVAVYKDRYRHAEIFYSSKKKIMMSWQNWRSGKTVVRELAETDTTEVDLKIEATEEKYAFWFQLPGKEWVKAGEVDTLELTCQDFTGPIFGVFAFGQGQVNFEQVDWSSSLNLP